MRIEPIYTTNLLDIIILLSILLIFFIMGLFLKAKASLLITFLNIVMWVVLVFFGEKIISLVSLELFKSNSIFTNKYFHITWLFGIMLIWNTSCVLPIYLLFRTKLSRKAVEKYMDNGSIIGTRIAGGFIMLIPGLIFASMLIMILIPIFNYGLIGNIWNNYIWKYLYFYNPILASGENITNIILKFREIL